MEEKALVTTQQMSLQDTLILGRVLAESGRFSDSTKAEQAVVKVLAGRELGFGPIASMTNINIIKGKVSTSANMMAHGVKRSAKYDYKVVELTPERCELAFFEGGKEIGRSTFDKLDAQKANTQNMGKFPRNMLFARAMSNGVKWYCPDVFDTSVYSPEELGVPVDGDGEIINVTPAPQPVQPTPAQKAKDELFSEYNHDGENKPKLEKLPPEKWDDIPPPESYTQLWGGEMWILIGFEHVNHVKNALKSYDPQNAGQAWGYLLEHQKSKLVPVTEAE